MRAADVQSLMADDQQGPDREQRAMRSRNVRTALILLSIAAVFFSGVIINRILAG